MKAQLEETRLRILEQADCLASSDIFVGFDGFVDEIIHVVDVRYSADRYERIITIDQYANRIAQAAGKSCNIEYVTIHKKSGGNGLIFADSLMEFQNAVTYMGAVGEPIDPVLLPFVNRCRRVFPLCESAHTDAVEFYDGKLIISKLDSFSKINWDRILQLTDENVWKEILKQNRLFAFMNWTMIPHLNEILLHILELSADVSTEGKMAFFDLADPQKRREEDLREVLEIITEYQKKFQVFLSVNYKEAQQIAPALGIRTEELRTMAGQLQEKLKIHGMVIHALKEAVCVIDGTLAYSEGPYCEKPVLTTGAGDHFNAGFCQGILMGLNPQQSLVLGVSNSGYYVRTGKSPSLPILCDFLAQWHDGKLIK